MMRAWNCHIRCKIEWGSNWFDRLAILSHNIQWQIIHVQIRMAWNVCWRWTFCECKIFIVEKVGKLDVIYGKMDYRRMTLLNSQKKLLKLMAIITDLFFSIPFPIHQMQWFGKYVLGWLFFDESTRLNDLTKIYLWKFMIWSKIFCNSFFLFVHRTSFKIIVSFVCFFIQLLSITDIFLS